VPEEEPTTEELQEETRRREARERAAAGRAADPEAEHAHVRRAEKSAYLGERLAERARAEREEA
jgi:hypothetical protein